MVRSVAALLQVDWRDLMVVSPEDQLLASAVVVVVAALLIGLFLPGVVRRVKQLVVENHLDEDAMAWTATVNDQFPVTTPVRFLLRSLQVVVTASTVLALLLIWEQVTLVELTVSTTWEALVAQGGLEYVRNIVVSLALAVAAYIGMGLLADSINSFRTETDRMTAHQEQIVTRVAQLSLLTVVGMVILGIWGINLGGLLVGAGFLGIVFGLAARQTIGSLIAGFVLMLSRPFEIGDWVQIGDQEGIVTEITIINTRLENFDGEFVVIPNDKVADRAITNRSRKGRLRLRVDVGIDYEADPEHATEVAEAAIETVEEVEETPPPHVFPKSFGDSAVGLEMRFWIDAPSPPKRWQAQAGVINAVKTAFDREGIKIPYPQRELAGRAETGGFRITNGTATAPEDEPEADEPQAYPDGDGTGEPR